MTVRTLCTLVFAGLAFMAPFQAMAQVIEERLISADPESGEDIFKRCKGCHTVDEGGANRVGPNLWSVIGRPVASADGYKRFSKALKEYGGEWTLEKLDAYLTKPRSAVPGTRMTFPGLPDEEDRANVIAYLNQHSAEPLEFGGDGMSDESSETVETGSADEDAEPEYGQLFVARGVEETFIYCTPCHSEMIVAQQGKTRDHWDELFDWMVEEQGMSEISEPERTIILDYLAEHYNEDRPNFPRAN